MQVTFYLSAVECPEPRTIAHGYHLRASSKYVYKDEITYACVEDYNLTDPTDSKRVCNGDGQWSPRTLPNCSCKYILICKYIPLS